MNHETQQSLEMAKSTWEQYRAKSRERVHLDSVGLPGFWVDIRRPGSFTLLEMEQIAKLTPDAGLKELKDVLPIIILDWNLTNPRDNKPLPPPSKQSTLWTEVLPMDVLNAISNKITELTTQESIIPEMRGT